MKLKYDRCTTTAGVGMQRGGGVQGSLDVLPSGASLGPYTSPELVTLHVDEDALVMIGAAKKPVVIPSGENVTFHVVAGERVWVTPLPEHDHDDSAVVGLALAVVNDAIGWLTNEERVVVLEKINDRWCAECGQQRDGHDDDDGKEPPAAA
jgi:hypothetical protein